MEEKMNEKGGSKVCTCCGACGCCGSWGLAGKGHMLLRIVLLLLILAIVFWVGVRVGEFKSQFMNGFEGRSYYAPSYYGYPMMGGGYYNRVLPPATAVPNSGASQ